MSEAPPTPCQAEWTTGVPCPHPAAEIAPAFRAAGYREEAKCYLHRNDNVVSKALRLLSASGYAVLMPCPEGCRQYGGRFGCDCKRQGKPARPRRDTLCRFEVEAAVEILQLALAELCARQADLSPHHFRQLADLTTARLILRRIENHLVAHGVVEEVVVAGEKGARTTSGRLSSFLEGRLRLAQLVRQHERDLGLGPGGVEPCR